VPEQSSDPEAQIVNADGEGLFQVKGLAPGAYRVSLADDEQATAQRVELAPGRDLPVVTLVVAAAGSLRVVVVGGGEGEHDGTHATLSVFASSQFGERPAQRENDGSYLLRDLPAGLYQVSVSNGKAANQSQQVQLAEGQQAELSFVLPEQDGVLSGRVVDGAGNALSDVWVQASRSAPSSPYESAPSAPVLTDADGNFELRELARCETYDVEAYIAQGSKTVSRNLRPGERVTLQLEADRKL